MGHYDSVHFVLPFIVGYGRVGPHGAGKIVVALLKPEIVSHRLPVIGSFVGNPCYQPVAGGRCEPGIHIPGISRADFASQIASILLEGSVQLNVVDASYDGIGDRSLILCCFYRPIGRALLPSGFGLVRVPSARFVIECIVIHHSS